MKIKFTKSFVCLFLILFTFGFTAKAEETVQAYLEFDTTSTKSEIRVDVVIKPSSSVGAFQAEYGYNPSYLQLKSISSNSGGKVYSNDENGNIGVIYMNEVPSDEHVLTLKFSPPEIHPLNL